MDQAITTPATRRFIRHADARRVAVLLAATAAAAVLGIGAATLQLAPPPAQPAGEATDGWMTAFGAGALTTIGRGQATDGWLGYLAPDRATGSAQDGWRAYLAPSAVTPEAQQAQDGWQAYLRP